MKLYTLFILLAVLYLAPTTAHKQVNVGKLLFHSGCQTCHEVSKGGFADAEPALGLNGDFDQILKRTEFTHFVDSVTGLRTPSLLFSANNINPLTGGELGNAGFNSTNSFEELKAFNKLNDSTLPGLETQVLVAITRHKIDYTKILERYPSINKALVDQYGANDSVAIAFAIADYERSLMPDKAPLLLGEGYSNKGLKAYRNQCASCHGYNGEGNTTLALKSTVSPFLGRYRLTKDSADLNIVKAPQLYNLADAPCYFHSCETISLSEAIEQCAEVHNAKCSKVLISFVEEALYDATLERYK